MVESVELLQTYLQALRRLSGAGAVSMFVPGGLSKPALLHEGDLPPVAELIDLATAEEFHRAIEPRLSLAAATSPLGHWQDSTESGCVLIRLPAKQALTLLSSGASVTEPGASRRKTDREVADGDWEWGVWLGARFAEEALPAMLAPPDPPPDSIDAVAERERWLWLLALGGALAWHSRRFSQILDDPITGLPGRVEFQVTLRQAMDSCRKRSRPITLLLVNPDDFGSVNERFGREAGDEVIREIAGRLRKGLRSTDPVAKYGGAIFASALVGASLVEARKAAEKIHRDLTEAAFLGGALRLAFSVGVSSFEPQLQPEMQDVDLMRQAAQALNAAQRAGGDCLAEWQEESEIQEADNRDQMSGIFTGNMAKDYRNMALLWTAISGIAASSDFAGLATEVCSGLYSTFKPEWVGVFGHSAETGLRLIQGVSRPHAGAGAPEPLIVGDLGQPYLGLTEQARAEGNAIERTVTSSVSDGGEVRLCAVPLIAGEEYLGCLYLERGPDRLALDASDLFFLKALATQLAVAFDRSRLAEQERRRQEQERRRLRAELEELRTALQQAKLVYRSAEIEALLATVRRVAPTDATVLVTGESGTGKELLARTIHELSPRRKKPLVVVDCGAIPATLMESELFGHEKGAYTGAQHRKPGRLAEAEGGSVLLDEIGELPLELQSKLLRFVQERQFMSVGGTRPRSVDVRIIAATNRDLGMEVAAGRFRQDLFYRLNVVHLIVPRLRDRPDDILYLASHFLNIYSLLYQKPVRRFTPEAEALLVGHPWPGNVRELQNRIMQAIILCEAEELGPDMLGFHEPQVGLERAVMIASPADLPIPNIDPAPFPVEAGANELASAATSGAALEPLSADVLWDRLRAGLDRQIAATVGNESEAVAILGEWLVDDLLLDAYEAAGDVARRAAARIGLAESTFRRRLARAQNRRQDGLATRSGSWPEVQETLAILIRSSGPESGDLLRRSETMLLEEVVAQGPGDVKTSCALLGITPPTFRRRLASLREARKK